MLIILTEIQDMNQMIKIIALANVGNSWKHYFLILTVLLFMVGCAQNTAYRTDFSVCTFSQEDDCVLNSIQHHAPDQFAMTMSMGGNVMQITVEKVKEHVPATASEGKILKGRE